MSYDLQIVTNAAEARARVAADLASERGANPKSPLVAMLVAQLADIDSLIAKGEKASIELANAEALAVEATQHLNTCDSALFFGALDRKEALKLQADYDCAKQAQRIRERPLASLVSAVTGPYNRAAAQHRDRNRDTAKDKTAALASYVLHGYMTPIHSKHELPEFGDPSPAVVAWHGFFERRELAEFAEKMKLGEFSEQGGRVEDLKELFEIRRSTRLSNAAAKKAELESQLRALDASA